MTELSVVVPVYGCDECLPVLHRRLTATLTGLGVPYELIFVDDRSPDRSWSVLLELARRDTAVRLFRLSRNFGEEAALTAGLAQSRGRYTVVMDCDLQDRPEDIPRLYAEALDGHEIVFARRIRRGHPRLRRAASRLYYSAVRRLFGSVVDPEFGNFSLVSRKAVDAVLSLRDRDRHYRAILAWIGFSHAAVTVETAPRHAGSSAYGLRTLLRHAVEGVFFESATLMRYIVYTGFVTAFAGMALAAFFVVSYLASDYTYPGWTSLAVLILVMTGVIIVSTGVTGLYIGRVFGQVKQRPLFIIDRVVADGAEQDPAAAARPLSYSAGPEPPPAGSGRREPVE